MEPALIFCAEKLRDNNCRAVCKAREEHDDLVSKHGGRAAYACQCRFSDETSYDYRIHGIV